jgi:hypothetical protein
MRKRVFARARPRRVPGSMNKLEAAYGAHLEAAFRAGAIAAFAFEPEKLRLADKTFFTPDFRVVTSDGFIEFHEVKGFWEDDARVKIKVAAEMHPYRFVAVTQERKTRAWVHEYFGGKDDEETAD